MSEGDRAEIGKSLECFDRVECVVSYLPETWVAVIFGGEIVEVSKVSE